MSTTAEVTRAERTGMMPAAADVKDSMTNEAANPSPATSERPRATGGMPPLSAPPSAALTMTTAMIATPSPTRLSCETAVPRARSNSAGSVPESAAVIGATTLMRPRARAA